MSHLEKYIKDEKKGEKEYKKLAASNPKEAKAFRKMAKDEERHEEELEKMEVEEKKGRMAKKMKRK